MYRNKEGYWTRYREEYRIQEIILDTANVLFIKYDTLQKDILL